MLTIEQIDRLLSQGANVLSGDGEKIGSIGQVFVDNEGGQPSWVTVRTGLFGMSESFVPLEGARAEGDDIVVPYSKNQVKDAPRIDSDRALEPDEEDRLYQHYQLETGRTYTEATADTPDLSAEPGTEGTGAPPTPGYDATAPTTDSLTEHRETTAPDPTTGRQPSAATGAPGHDTTAPTTADAPAPAAQDTTATGRVAPAAPAGTPGFGTTAPAPAGTLNEQRDTTAPDRTTTREPSETTGTPGHDTTASATDDTLAPAAQDTTATDRNARPATTGAPGFDTTASASHSTLTEQRDTTATDRGTPAAPTGAPGYDTTAPATDDALSPAAQDTTAPDRGTRPATTGTAEYDTTGKDRGAEQPATGQGRLRKYVTTEYVTRTVPVQREEVRIEREPIAEEDRGELVDRADDENEVILHEERVIVTKETVPVERVHIGTETVTEDVTIKEKVRKEHIDTEGPEESVG